MWVDTGVVKNAGVFGWTYNRANYKFDQGLRWQRYNVGRKMAIAQMNMFRQDVSDLATVSMSKMKIYAPIMTMSLGYCITIFVEGRSGLKFPGPPVFVSGIYLQCLGVGFGFLTLGVWLAFHAAIRAQVAAVSLRTRKVRLPVPTQRQLDSARKFLSSWEEQNLYDMFRLPFIMPNGANSPHASDDEDDEPELDEYAKGTKDKKKGEKGETAPKPPQGVHMPGTTKGNPTWLRKELDEGKSLPKASPSGNGLEGPTEPFEHFELMRQAQKDYWSAEAYTRICFLYGMMHLIQSFAYWLVLHNIAELGLIWCAIICAAALQAGVWLMFRLDVLPEKGGMFPIEASGPFVAAITLALMYTAHPNDAIIDWSRAIAAGILIMHVIWSMRLYIVAMPSYNPTAHKARESGGRMFNESGACEVPQWLPASFQHVSYLVAPPKTKEQLDQERTDQMSGNFDDPLVNVDMTPWYYTRTMLQAVILGWLLLLTGRIVEIEMGERMLVTNPGSPPWTRIGQWYGWEFGPITSKHYAHVTPMKGHFGWQTGWGPQGQQEIWASDMFGFHPEADAHWAEPKSDGGPAPLVGAAGIGKNTWASGLIAYGKNEGEWAPTGDHDFDSSGGHRRLNGVFGINAADLPSVVRAVVPAALQWPALLEPELLACSPAKMGGVALALSANGRGAFVPAGVAAGKVAGMATPFALGGLLEFGMARGVTWAESGLLVVTGSGAVVTCSVPENQETSCSPMAVPELPMINMRDTSAEPNSLASHAVVFDVTDGQELTLRAAVATQGSSVTIFELQGVTDKEWQQVDAVSIPKHQETLEIASISASSKHVLLTMKDGAAYEWKMNGGRFASTPRREMPVTAPGRTWWSGCALPNGNFARLASNWQREVGGALVWHPELLI